MKRLSGPAVRQAQRFARPVETFDPMRPPEDRSEAEEDRHAEYAQEGRVEAEEQAAEVEAEQTIESEEL